MTKRSLLILSAVLLSGCKSDGPKATGPTAIPADAKFTEAKDPPINADTRYATGQLAESAEKWDYAINQYQEALKTDPKHAPSLYRLGVLYSQQKQYDLAIMAWQKYILATNDSANGWGNLGFCYQLSGDLEKAEWAYKKGIDLEAKNQICRINYGLMLAQIGKTNEALANFQAVLTPAAAHYNLGSVYEQQKKIAQAKLEYVRALELDPTFFDAQQRLASLE